MTIPFINLQKSTALVRSEILPLWERVLDKQEFVGGPSVKELEERLKEKLKVKAALPCANGTDALLIALQAMGVKAGDKVAIPNLTFWATYEAAAQLGAVPVLIDIDPENLQMDLSEFKKAFEKYHFHHAILVHLMGWASPETEEFRKFCLSNDIQLLEDGAQSYGVSVAGQSVYSGAKLSTLSFYPAKVIGGCMDGGAIVGSDVALIEKCRSLCNHGRASHYSYDYVGWNSRMGGLQAAFLNETLKHDDVILNERREWFSLYMKRLDGKHPSLRCYQPPQDVLGNGYLSVLTIRDKSVARIAEFLKAKGIATGRVYPETLDQQPPAQGALRISELKNSREFCAQVLNLPLFYGMTQAQVEQSAETLLIALKETV